MKILCVIDSLGSGGAQRQLVELAIGFKREGHDVSLLVYHEKMFFKNLLDEAEIPINVIIEHGHLRRLITIRNFIRSSNSEVVLSFLEAPSFICEIAGFPYRNWKLVVGERSANPQILKSFKLRFYRWFHFFADYIVANSHENIRIIKKVNPLLPSRKFSVIYNLVDFSKWQPKDQSALLGGETLHLLVAASHGLNKNLNGLLEALNILHPENRVRIRVNWFGGNGEGDVPRDIYRKISQYNLQHNIGFFPATNDLNNLMKQTDIVGLFSFYEGLPNSVCEAMAAGKPVIASAVSDIPNLIKNKNFLFNPHKPDSIAECLRYVLNMDPDHLIKEGQRNRKRAENIFNNQKIIDKYLNLFKS